MAGSSSSGPCGRGALHGALTRHMVIVSSTEIRESNFWEFLGDLVVMTWHFHNCGPGLIPGLGTEIQHQVVACFGQNGKKKKERLAGLKSHFCIVSDPGSPLSTLHSPLLHTPLLPPQTPAALSPESLDSHFLFNPLHQITGVPHHVRRGRGHQLRDHHQGEFRRRPPLRGPRVATAGIVFGARQLGAPTPLLLFSAGNPRAPVLGPLAAHSLCVRGRGWEAPRASVMPVGEWARGPQGPGGAGAAAERL